PFEHVRRAFPPEQPVVRPEDGRHQDEPREIQGQPERAGTDHDDDRVGHDQEQQGSRSHQEDHRSGGEPSSAQEEGESPIARGVDPRPGEQGGQEDQRAGSQGKERRAQHLVGPDGPARQRPGEIEPKPALAQIVGDDRGSQDPGQEGAGDERQPQGHAAAQVGRVLPASAGKPWGDDREEAGEDGAQEEEPPLGELSSENGEERFHCGPPGRSPGGSPTRATKISSSVSAETSAAAPAGSTERSSSQPETTASTRQPRDARATGPSSASCGAFWPGGKLSRRNRRFRTSTSSSRTSRPSLRIPTRSAMPSTPPRSWLVRKTVVPRSANSPISSSKTDRRATGSSPRVGSSRISRRGSGARASPRATCPRWPRESLPKGTFSGTPNRRRRAESPAASQRG